MFLYIIKELLTLYVQIVKTKTDSFPYIYTMSNTKLSKAVNRILFVLLLVVSPFSLWSQTDTLQYKYIPLTQEQVDSIVSPELLAAISTDTLDRSQKQPVGLFSQLFKRQNKFLSYLDGLASGNVDRSFERPIDINFVLMPSYTREGSFGIGGGATGLFRLDKQDSIMQPSDVTLIGNATINGLFSLTANGNVNFPGRRWRLTYKLEYTFSPLDFWGISRDACAVNPATKYTRNQLKFNSDMVYAFSGPFKFGGLFDLVYSEITSLDRPEYLEGQKSAYYFTTLGMSFQYDTRDFVLNPRRGMNLMIRAGVRPQFMGTYNRTLFNGSITYNYYLGLWKDCTLALDAYGSFNSTHSPWPLREALGSGGIRMRGYYAGRYVDNNMVSVQAELRQHIWNRFGCTVWGGAANVFSSFGKFQIRQALPNFGVGLRVELKHNVNGRIDFGFGKGTSGFVFAIGEAF